jgi:hypothetical protein
MTTLPGNTRSMTGRTAPQGARSLRRATVRKDSQHCDSKG